MSVTYHDTDVLMFHFNRLRNQIVVLKHGVIRFRIVVSRQLQTYGDVLPKQDEAMGVRK
jgi:hypothetical protein